MLIGHCEPCCLKYGLGLAKFLQSQCYNRDFSQGGERQGCDLWSVIRVRQSGSNSLSASALCLLPLPLSVTLIYCPTVYQSRI